MKVLQSKFIYECISIVQENFGQKKPTPIFAWKVKMGLTNCNTFKILMTYLEEVNLCIIQLLVFQL